MIKKFIFLILLFLSSCGYEAIYSQKKALNNNFYISELTFIGEKSINLKIKQSLNNYTLVEKKKNFSLRISSKAEKIILSKDSSGDPTSYKSTIIIDIEILKENNFRRNLQIIEDFNYDNIGNKFELKEYENEIRSNLTETAVKKLIFRLSNI